MTESKETLINYYEKLAIFDFEINRNIDSFKFHKVCFPSQY
jgi:hypothetical protein